MKPKEASIYRSEYFHSAGSVHFLTCVDKNLALRYLADPQYGSYFMYPFPTRVSKEADGTHLIWDAATLGTETLAPYNPDDGSTARRIW